MEGRLSILAAPVFFPFPPRILYIIESPDETSSFKDEKGRAMSSASASTPRPEPDPAQQILQLATGYMPSSALFAITSLNVPDFLKTGPQAVSTLAAKTGSNEDALYRILRALSSVGVFYENPARTFALTPISELLCTGQRERDMVLWLSDPFHLQVYQEAAHAIHTGETVPEKIFGLPCFDYLAQNKEVGDRFNNAMTGFSAMLIGAALDAYDFSWLAGKTLVDVAGGQGMVLTEILRKYPLARGILFDQEQVVAGAKPLIESNGLADRCAVAHGDFFTAVPEGDAYIMKHVIHDWNDDRAGTILRSIHRAARPSARVILIECILAPGNEPHFAKWIDMEMLLLPGGRERTEDEFGKLFADNGFKMTRIVPTESLIHVIESVRQS